MKPKSWDDLAREKWEKEAMFLWVKFVHPHVSPQLIYTDWKDIKSEFIKAFVSALSSADREATERAASVAKNFKEWNELSGKDSQELTALRIQSAIRNQQGVSRE